MAEVERRKGGGRKRMAHYRDLVQNYKGLVRVWCDSTPVTLSNRGLEMGAQSTRARRGR